MSALEVLFKAIKDRLAQEFLGWALKLAPHEVMQTVALGIAEGEKRAGKPSGTYVRKYS